MIILTRVAMEEVRHGLILDVVENTASWSF